MGAGKTLDTPHPPPVLLLAALLRLPSSGRAVFFCHILAQTVMSSAWACFLVSVLRCAGHGKRTNRTAETVDSDSGLSRGTSQDRWVARRCRGRGSRSGGAVSQVNS